MATGRKLAMIKKKKKKKPALSTFLDLAILFLHHVHSLTIDC